MKRNYLICVFAALMVFGWQQVYSCEGCTYTQGYWKTHTKYDGPKKADVTWQLVGGEDCGFWKSGKSFYEVMLTAPKGNAYYILAHQFIAAQLNLMKDEWLSATAEVVDAMKSGMVLFKNYTPDEIAELKGKNGKELRSEFISISGVLDNFNNGLIGPGHCDVLRDKSISVESNRGDYLTEIVVNSYPNPFSELASFTFELPEESEVVLTILNLSGQEVEVVTKGFYSAGVHTINWVAPQDMSSGYFLYNFKVGGSNFVNKMLKK